MLTAYSRSWNDVCKMLTLGTTFCDPIVNTKLQVDCTYVYDRVRNTFCQPSLSDWVASLTCDSADIATWTCDGSSSCTSSASQLPSAAASPISSPSDGNAGSLTLSFLHKWDVTPPSGSFSATGSVLVTERCIPSSSLKRDTTRPSHGGVRLRHQSWR